MEGARSLLYDRGAMCLLGVIAVAATGFVWLCTSRYGIGITPDVLRYVSVADGLIAGRGFVTFEGEVYCLWPPLHPIILALVGMLVGSAEIAARITNAVCVGLLVLMVPMIVRECGGTRAIAVLGAMLIALSYPVYLSATFGFSEPLFAVLFAGFLLVGLRFDVYPSRGGLCMMAALAALGSLQRYVGVCAIAVGMLLCIAERGRQYRDRVRRACLFGIGTSVPLLAWFGRNTLVSGAPGGVRYEAQRGFVENLAEFGGGLFALGVPRGQGSDSAKVVGTVFVGLIIALVCLKGFRSAVRAKREGGFLGALRRYLPWPVIAYVMLYTAGLLCIASITKVDGVGGRHTVPVLVGVVILFCTGVSAVLRGSNVFLRGGMAIVIAWSVLDPSISLANWYFTHSRGWGAGGYNTIPWRESELMGWIREESLCGNIYSNAGPAIYYLAGIGTRELPRAEWEIEEFRRKVEAQGRDYVILFYHLSERGGVSKRGIEMMKTVRAELGFGMIGQFADGEVYVRE